MISKYVVKIECNGIEQFGLECNDTDFWESCIFYIKSIETHEIEELNFLELCRQSEEILGVVALGVIVPYSDEAIQIRQLLSFEGKDKYYAAENEYAYVCEQSSYDEVFYCRSITTNNLCTWWDMILKSFLNDDFALVFNENHLALIINDRYNNYYSYYKYIFQILDLTKFNAFKLKYKLLRGNS